MLLAPLSLHQPKLTCQLPICHRVARPHVPATAYPAALARCGGGGRGWRCDRGCCVCCDTATQGRSATISQSSAGRSRLQHPGASQFSLPAACQQPTLRI